MQFGVLIPHFGVHASPEVIIKGSRTIEEMGFDSVWVRDHILWRPHGMEGNDLTFVEPFVCLAAIAAVTSRIKLGTAVLIPVRWPLKVAQDLASLDYLSGGRVLAGVGLGGNEAELAAAGFKLEDRETILKETVEISEKVWGEDNVSYHGNVFSFDNVTIAPKPASRIPFYYGGTTRASVRRAVAYTEGWLPGRIPLQTFDDRLELLRTLGAEQGKKMTVGVIPLIKVRQSRSEAFAGIDVKALAESSGGSKYFIQPPGGFSSVEDLEGLLIAGSPDDCKLEIRKFAKRKVEHLIFDLRLEYHRYLETLELIADRVLPEFR